MIGLEKHIKNYNKRMERAMINKLIQKIQKTNAPIVVGLDPTMKFVPEHIHNLFA